MRTIETNAFTRSSATPIYRAPLARPPRPPPAAWDPSSRPPNASNGLPVIEGASVDRSSFQSSAAASQSHKATPAGYICYRCGQKGTESRHFVSVLLPRIHARSFLKVIGFRIVRQIVIELGTINRGSSERRVFPRVSSPRSKVLEQLTRRRE